MQHVIYKAVYPELLVGNFLTWMVVMMFSTQVLMYSVT